MICNQSKRRRSGDDRFPLQICHDSPEHTDLPLRKRRYLGERQLAEGTAPDAPVLAVQKKEDGGLSRSQVPNLPTILSVPEDPISRPSSSSSSSSSKRDDSRTKGATPGHLLDGILDLILAILRNFQSPETIALVQEPQLRTSFEVILKRSRLGTTGLLYALVYLKRASCSWQGEARSREKSHAFGPSCANEHSTDDWLPFSDATKLHTPPSSARGSPETDQPLAVPMDHLGQALPPPISSPLSNGGRSPVLGNTEQSSSTVRCSSHVGTLDLRALFLTAVILAHKYIHDKAYRLDAWINLVTPLSTSDGGESKSSLRRSILDLERRFLCAFDYRCAVTLEELVQIGGVMKAILGWSNQRRAFEARAPTSSSGSLETRPDGETMLKSSRLTHNLVLVWLRASNSATKVLKPSQPECKGSVKPDLSISSALPLISPQEVGLISRLQTTRPSNCLRPTSPQTGPTMIIPTPELESSRSSSSTPSQTSSDSPDSCTFSARPTPDLVMIKHPDMLSQSSKDTIQSQSLHSKNYSCPQTTALMMAHDRARREWLEAAMKADDRSV